MAQITSLPKVVVMLWGTLTTTIKLRPENFIKSKAKHKYFKKFKQLKPLTISTIYYVTKLCVSCKCVRYCWQILLFTLSKFKQNNKLLYLLKSFKIDRFSDDFTGNRNYKINLLEFTYCKKQHLVMTLHYGNIDW